MAPSGAWISLSCSFRRTKSRPMMEAVTLRLSLQQARGTPDTADPCAQTAGQGLPPPQHPRHPYPWTAANQKLGVPAGPHGRPDSQIQLVPQQLHGQSTGPPEQGSSVRLQRLSYRPFRSTRSTRPESLEPGSPATSRYGFDSTAPPSIDRIRNISVRMACGVPVSPYSSYARLGAPSLRPRIQQRKDLGPA